MRVYLTIFSAFFTVNFTVIHKIGLRGEGLGGPPGSFEDEDVGGISHISLSL